MKTFTYPQSQQLFKRALKTIPGGIYGHLGMDRGRLIPVDAYPLFSQKAKGTYIWDVDGNKFIDYACGYGVNLLGYQDPDVDAAAEEQRKKGDTTTIVSPVMIELAELLVDTVNSADWAFFAKNGSDVTTLAVMTARAATGRKKIVKMSGGYHGVDAWAQRKGNSGILESDVAHELIVEFNNYEMLERVVTEHKGEIAGMISMPYHHTTFFDNIFPDPDYWPKVRKLCTDHGIALIFDDVRAGFRMDLKGSDHYFGIQADLICFSKAIANGYSLSVLCGHESLKETVESITYTGSFWLSAVPIAAGVATIQKLKEIDGITKMNRLGKKLTDGIVEIGRRHHFEVIVSGMPSLFFLRLADPDESMILHQKWISEIVRRGIYFSHYHNMFMNCAITNEDIDDTLSVVDEAFRVLRKNDPIWV